MKLMPWRSKEKDDSHAVPTPSRWGDLERYVDRFFSNPWSSLDFNSDVFGNGAWIPPVDITETDGEVLIRSEIPGVEPKDLSITVSGDVLTLSGEKTESAENKGENFFHTERRFGSFRRSIQLPGAVDSDKVKAEYHNGVLTVTLERNDGARAKRIPVSSRK